MITRASEDIAMHLPFEPMTFVLPKRCFVHPTYRDIEFISYGRGIMGKRKDGNPDGFFSIFTYIVGHPSLMRFGSDNPIIPLGNIDKFHAKVSAGSDVILESEHLTYDAVDEHSIQKHALHLLFGAILLMAARPSLVTGPLLIKRVQLKRDQPNEFWTPRVLGEHYKVRAEPSAPGVGHHSGPRYIG